MILRRLKVKIVPDVDPRTAAERGTIETLVGGVVESYTVDPGDR